MSSSDILPPSSSANHLPKVIGLSILTCTFANGLTIAEPGAMNFLAPIIAIGTTGTSGNLADNRATPVLPLER